MSQFNARDGVLKKATKPRSAMRAGSSFPDVLTHEGGSAYSMTPQTELVIMLAGSFVKEESFYTENRIDRLRTLVEQITAADSSDNKADSGLWFAGFTKWLRTEAYIRTGSIILAVESVHHRLAVNAYVHNRDIVNFACDRGDEPGELLAYWLTTYGKTVPIAVKRGLSDAVVRLYSEYSALRYDTNTFALRFGDVVDIVQPRTNARPSLVRNDTLLRYLIDRRHEYNTNRIPDSLEMMNRRLQLEELPVEQRRDWLLGQPEVLGQAGMHLEAFSGWLQGPLDKDAWEALIPTMGYMALLRNLRNFDEAGVSREVADRVAQRLADPGNVAKSKQLPFRFWTAYREVSNDRWRVALGDALAASVQNIPTDLGRRTLVLVDTSYSMTNRLSEKSSVSLHEVAGLFGVALAMKFGVDNVDLFGFATTSYRFPLKKGASILDQTARFYATNGNAGHGTEMEDAVSSRYNGHDRVVIFSDMQTFGENRPYGYRSFGALRSGQRGRTVSEIVPANVPVHAFHLGGYGTTVVGDAPNRFQIGGLTDKTFQLMPLLEKGSTVGWPWELSEGVSR